MAFSIGFGPIRWYSRGSRYRSKPLTFEEVLIFGAVGLGTLGAWGAVEGLAGSWGVTGRVFGVLFLVGTVVSFVDRRAAIVFVTSWVYLGLVEVGYLDLLLAFFEWLGDPVPGGESVDEFVVSLLRLGLGMAVPFVMLFAPPIAVDAVLQRWQRRSRRARDETAAVQGIPDAPGDADGRPLTRDERRAWRRETRRLYREAMRPSAAHLRDRDWWLSRTPEQRAFRSRARSRPSSVEGSSE